MRVQAAELMGPDFLANLAVVFRSLDAWPRCIVGRVTGAAGSFDPAGRYRGRYLAEHAIPLVLKPDAACYLLFLPTTGNRVKVRRLPAIPLLARGLFRLLQLCN